MNLNEIMDKYTDTDVAVAFSGGADSTLVLKLAVDFAKKKGIRVYAVTAKTVLHSLAETEYARRLAKELGAIYKCICVDELEEIKNNPENRCYLCKKYIFSKIKELAEELGVKVILEGTNADDIKEYRPGIKALGELGIKSPLLEAGVTKDKVRALLEDYGIETSKKPSMPCLATRFPYGTALIKEELERVLLAEEYIRSLGFDNVRARVHGDVLRIEVDDIDRLFDLRSDVIKRMKEIGYRFVTLDLEGFRSGCYDKGL